MQILNIPADLVPIGVVVVGPRLGIVIVSRDNVLCPITTKVGNLYRTWFIGIPKHMISQPFGTNVSQFHALRNGVNHAIGSFQIAEVIDADRPGDIGTLSAQFVRYNDWITIAADGHILDRGAIVSESFTILLDDELSAGHTQAGSVAFHPCIAAVRGGLQFIEVDIHIPFVFGQRIGLALEDDVQGFFRCQIDIFIKRHRHGTAPRRYHRGIGACGQGPQTFAPLQRIYVGVAFQMVLQTAREHPHQ